MICISIHFNRDYLFVLLGKGVIMRTDPDYPQPPQQRCCLVSHYISDTTSMCSDPNKFHTYGVEVMDVDGNMVGRGVLTAPSDESTPVRVHEIRYGRADSPR